MEGSGAQASRGARKAGPQTGCSLADLAKAAEMTQRAIRFYIKRGLLPAVVFRGGSTVYGEEYLLRHRAIARLRADDGLPLDAIKRRLAKLSPAELAALAALGESPHVKESLPRRGGKRFP